MERQYGPPILIVATGMLILGILTVTGAGSIVPPGGDAPNEGPEPDWTTGGGNLDTFESADEFRAYFTARNGDGSHAALRSFDRRGGTADAVTVEVDVEAGDASAGSVSEAPEHSSTNVQVQGIDEPDRLKTDGEVAYYAGYEFRRTDTQTTVLRLDDPGAPEVTATVPAAGDLLLVDGASTLLIFNSDRIVAYDIADPSEPEESWVTTVDGSIETARLLNGSVYVVTSDRPNVRAERCEITPLGDQRIPCTDIYRPSQQADAETVYTAGRLDLTAGEFETQSSVVGSSRHTATYVSNEAIYLTYTRSTSRYELHSTFLTGPGAKHLDQDVVTQIEELEDLNISTAAKATELRVIMETWMENLPEDEREERMDALEETFNDFTAEHQRNLTSTGIVRISLNDELTPTATGEVPGYPLNQWALDEHENHLRIATTIPGHRGTDSVNDVYVLDQELNITGSVTGLGKTERIYAVRFNGDQGQVVTFRQIDPFYTLDLSDPANPVLEGELKIPGFSTYLHPLDEDEGLMLGVGEQDGHVKLSLFDTAERTNPTELDAVTLDNEKFSVVNRNHRAFLHDDRHGIFFIPGEDASYVYSYADDELTEEARIDVGGHGVRAMYIEDYLYVFGQDEVVVLDETSWAVETRVDL